LAGVNGLQVKDLRKNLKNNMEQIESEIRQGGYPPQAILGVEVPRCNKKPRLPGIPNLTDRLIQQATKQVTAARCQLHLKDHSYGFRPNRNAQPNKCPFTLRLIGKWLRATIMIENFPNFH